MRSHQQPEPTFDDRSSVLVSPFETETGLPCCLISSFGWSFNLDERFFASSVVYMYIFLTMLQNSLYTFMHIKYEVNTTDMHTLQNCDSCGYNLSDPFVKQESKNLILLRIKSRHQTAMQVHLTLRIRYQDYNLKIIQKIEVLDSLCKKQGEGLVMEEKQMRPWDFCAF